MDLLAALHATWPPAEAARVGPWTVRRGEGGGRRVSAATLEAPGGDPEAAAAAMRAWGERPVFMVRDGEDALDAALAARGYRREAPTLIYAAPAEAVAHAAADVTVIDCEGPLALMAELWAAGGVGPARLAVMARPAGPKRYLLGRLDDRPAAAGFVAVAGEVAMLHALHVAPWARRRGLGRRLAQWAAAWGSGAGARVFAAAVEADNGPARALHEGLGMRLAGGYHYRVAD